MTFIPYGSSGHNFKYRHFLDDIRYDLNAPELALLSVLLLRGAQTLNELKIRTASQYAFAAPEAVESALQALAAREKPLAQKLEKRPGWKEIRWRHSLYEYGEGEAGWVSGEGEGHRLHSLANAAHSDMPSNQEFAQPAGTTHDWQSEIAALKEELAQLRTETSALREEIGELRRALGG